MHIRTIFLQNRANIGTIYDRILKYSTIMQKISKSLEELVQEKLLSKKAADIAPNAPKTPNVANTAPKTSTMEDGTYYLEPSKDDPNKLVGKIWGKRPTDPEALKRYQEVFERTYAMNHPLQKATQQWGKNIGYGKNYTDSAQVANRKLRQEEIGGAENVDQAGDSTFTRLRKGWNRAKAQNNLPEMRRYQNQMNTEWANYARAAGLKTPKDLLGKLSKEQMAQINAANVQAMFPDMQRWTVAGDKFDANALAKQKNIYIPKIEDIKIKDALEGFAGAGKGAPEDIAKRRQEIYNERIEAMRKAYKNDPEKSYLFEKALGNNINKTIKAQGTPATEEQKKQLAAQKERIQNAANKYDESYGQKIQQKQQTVDLQPIDSNSYEGQLIWEAAGNTDKSRPWYRRLFNPSAGKRFRPMPGEGNAIFYDRETGNYATIRGGELYNIPAGNLGKYRQLMRPEKNIITGKSYAGDIEVSPDGKTYTSFGKTYDTDTGAERTSLSGLSNEQLQAELNNIQNQRNAIIYSTKNRGYVGNPYFRTYQDPKEVAQLKAIRARQNELDKELQRRNTAKAQQNYKVPTSPSISGKRYW